MFSEEGTVLGRVFAADPDEDQELQFSILGRFFSLGSFFFAIDSDDGSISFSDSSLFNHAVSEVSLRVIVVDNGSPSLNNTLDFAFVFM